MQPYADGERLLLDVQTIIPLPETEMYQVQIREKQQEEKQHRESSRDFTKYDLHVDGGIIRNLAKRNLMFQIVRTAINANIAPEEIAKSVPWRENALFATFDGELDESEFCENLMKQDTGGKLPKTKRYFCKKEELFYCNGKSYALSNQWGRRTEEAAMLIIKAFQGLKMEFKESP